MPRPAQQSTRFLALLSLATCSSLPSRLAAQRPAAADFRADWALAEGFTLRRDAQGFHFPTSMVFVPEPGPGPKDPLYFVTEIGGTIKVVTNDRTVSDFAVGVMPKPTGDTLPSYTGESGLAGLCLEPRHGYVFATFAYTDSSGVLRNGLARFETGSSRFALTPTSKTLYTDLFLHDVSAISHQIGPCQATPAALFVSVGDGEDHKASRNLGSTLGKLLRLTLDGRPAPGNPHAKGGAEAIPASVWAYGLRNPFGLKVVGSQVLVADNGNDLDRFLEIEPGTDYRWDGTDLSIGMNAAMVFGPAVSPVQMDYCRAGTAGLPASWADRFFVALSGTPRLTGAEDRHGKGVYALQYGLREHRMLEEPKYLMQYRGDGYQSVVGLGCGPDAVYVVPIFPDHTGVTAILAVTYDSTAVYPYGLAADTKPIRLMEDEGCFGCHSLQGKGGTAGPPLDRDSLVARLTDRLFSKEYRRSIDSVDALPVEPFVSSRKARHDVLAVDGMDRIQLWMRHHILQPKFDNPKSQMPALGLTEGQAVALTDFLLAGPSTPGSKRHTGRRRLALAFAVGLVVGGAGMGAVAWWWRRRRPA
ncbi:MAG TPA: PQQ-dependent sugar dehydrogenase [Gemmatimonadales bacterium]|nr:PQQ-dependent sugar dehydrogenase [Gemmatimonadales bacterium]